MNHPSTDVESEPESIGPDARGRLVYVIPEQAYRASEDEEINLRDIWNTLWQRKWLIIGAIVVFALGSVTYALLATEWYRAEVLLAPAEERTMQPLAGQLGGLAALAGVSVGGGDGAEAIAVLRSRELAQAFIERFALITVFFADEWDAERQRWMAQDPKDWPDVRDAVRYFHKGVLNVSEDRRNRMVTLAIEWTDPEIAAEWAGALAGMVNARLRARALHEAEVNVAYLQTEMAKTSVVSLQQSIGRLLESELQKLMLARGNEEFAFRVIDGPVPPKERVRPKRALIAIIGCLLGGVLGVLAVLVADAMRQEA